MAYRDNNTHTTVAYRDTNTHTTVAYRDNNTHTTVAYRDNYTPTTVAYRDNNTQALHSIRSPFCFLFINKTVIIKERLCVGEAIQSLHRCLEPLYSSTGIDRMRPCAVLQFYHINKRAHSSRTPANCLRYIAYIAEPTEVYLSQLHLLFDEQGPKKNGPFPKLATRTI